MGLFSEAIIIRPYESRDRQDVRRICCETADRGQPVERFYPHRDVAADLLTAYYTDFEPDSSWVAEKNNQVIGYLNGCMDSRRYRFSMFFKVIPRTIIQAQKTGVLWKRANRRWLVLGVKSWFLGGILPRVSWDSYPAHVHINISEHSRGRAVGRKLMEKFFEQAQKNGVQGVHAVVSENNPEARMFFEKMGFVPINRRRMMAPDGNTDRLSHSIIYGKELNDTRIKA